MGEGKVMCRVCVGCGRCAIGVGVRESGRWDIVGGKELG